MKTRMALAKKFHNLYEMYAPDFGYETREETKKFNPDTPNGRLMLYVCEKILMDYDITEAKGIKDLSIIKADDNHNDWKLSKHS